MRHAIFILTVLVSATAFAAGAAVAEPVELEVAGQHVRVTAAERQSMHGSSSTPYSESSYHQESVTSGVRVNGEGTSVTVTNYTGRSSYFGPGGTAEQERAGGRVLVEGDAAGMAWYESAQATHYDSSYDFGELARGHGHTLVLSHYGYAYGRHASQGSNNAASVGAGEVASSYLNANPVLGVIAFASGAAYTQNHASATGFGFGSYGGASETTYAGDYTGADGYASWLTARCAYGQCQWDYVGASGCIVGVRFPFFVACSLLS